jgi:hypothetical protein
MISFLYQEILLTFERADVDRGGQYSRPLLKGSFQLVDYKRYVKIVQALVGQQKE